MTDKKDQADSILGALGIPSVDSPEGLKAIEDAVREIMYIRILSHEQRVALGAIIKALPGEFGVHLIERRGDPLFIVQQDTEREFAILSDGRVEEIPEHLRLSNEERERGQRSGEAK